MVEDGRLELPALVGSLPVERRRIMEREEILAQVSERAHITVESDMEHHHVARIFKLEL